MEKDFSWNPFISEFNSNLERYGGVSFLKYENIFYFGGKMINNDDLETKCLIYKFSTVLKEWKTVRFKGYTMKKNFI